MAVVLTVKHVPHDFVNPGDDDYYMVLENDILVAHAIRNGEKVPGVQTCGQGSSSSFCGPLLQDDGSAESCRCFGFDSDHRED